MIQQTGLSKYIPRYIAVEGPIGVGKTSLTKRLAETFNYETLLEKSDENPFLDRFYENPKIESTKSKFGKIPIFWTFYS